MPRTSDTLLQGSRLAASRRWRLAALLLGALAASHASAQVIRCTDARTGRVTYTNGSCGEGENRVLVQEAPSAEELERDRAQAAAAIERKNQQLARDEAERRERQRQRDNEARERAQARPQRAGNGDSPACQQARRRLDAILAEARPDPSTWGARSQAAQQQMEMACLGPEAYGQLQSSRTLQPNAINRPWVVTPSRPLPTPPSAPITGCNVFRCYDKNGGVHPIP